MFIPFTVGGGIRAVDDARRMLRAGADKVSVNTAAVQRPELIAEIAAEFGAQCCVCAIDAKRRDARRPSAFEVYLHGGRTPTGIDAVEWAVRAAALGAGEILLTSMDRDGTRDGFDLELTAAIADAVNVPVIASGGVGTLQHLVEGIIEGGADAACWRRRSSTSASTPIAEAEAAMTGGRRDGAARPVCSSELSRRTRHRADAARSAWRHGRSRDGWTCRRRLGRQRSRRRRSSCRSAVGESFVAQMKDRPRSPRSHAGGIDAGCNSFDNAEA